METTSLHPPLLSPPTTLDTMASTSPVFLKLEDLQNSPPPPSSFDDGSIIQSTPATVVVHSKPAKKRKSWGQELPEPKTALPPRKRAKTDDEKEQRRIERIKRNRAAAHNSRERKRQETDTLAVALARANAELDAYRKHFGALPSNVVLPEVTLSTDSVDTPAPSLVESSRLSVDAGTAPPTPADTLFDYPTIKEEPSETTFIPTAPLFENLSEAKPALTQQLDPTQHSAAMLCDLQCRSSRSPSSSSNNPNNTSSTWAGLFLYLMTLQLQTGYKAILLALWTHSPSRITRLMQASTPRWTSPSTTSSTTTPLLLPWTLAVAQRNAATGLVHPQQGASSLALQRRLVLEALRRGGLHAVAAKQQCQNSDFGMAFRESDGKSRVSGNPRGREADDATGR